MLNSLFHDPTPEKQNPKAPRVVVSKTFTPVYDIVNGAIGNGDRSDTRKANISSGFDKFRNAGFQYARFFIASKNDETVIMQVSKTWLKDSIKLGKKNDSANGSGTDLTFPQNVIDDFGFEHKQVFDMLPKWSDLSSNFIDFELKAHDPLLSFGVPFFKVSIPGQDPDRFENQQLAVQIKQTTPVDYELEARRLQRQVEVNPITRELIRNQLLYEEHLKTGKPIHTDHMFSIAQGKRYKIPVYVISHWTNLEYLTDFDNMSKGARCSKTLRCVISDYGSAEGLDMSQRRELLEQCDLALAMLEGV
ncbi:hypothetical protein D3C71_813600 [compost metagenome]